MHQSTKHIDTPPLPLNAQQAKTRRSRVMSGTAPIALAALSLAAPAIVRAQGVRFTLSPAAEYTWWDKSLGIKDGELLGGRVGADFGSLLSVSGYFHTRGGLGVQRDSLPPIGGVLPSRSNKTDVATYGVNLALRLSAARFAPFISAGAGVIRFDPDSAQRIEQINYRYGGGFHYDMSPNIRAMAMVEDSRFRLAPNALFRTPSTVVGGAGSDKQTTRSNWVVSAGLGIAVGGSLDGVDPEADRWSVASIPVEAYAGRIEFDDATLPRQAFAGVRTGIDVGNYVGLRGFYWQGRTGDLRNKQNLNSYGGEAQFNLNASRGPAPFLIVGAGRLDFENNYKDTQGRTRADETALILGGGIGIRLSDFFRLNAAARDYVRGPQQIDSISGLKQLSNNWMYSVGIGYSINRSRRAAARPSPRDRQRDTIYLADVERRDAMSRDAMPRGASSRDATARDATRRDRAMADSTLRTERERAMPATRTITLPVPVVGELYVRYGDSTSRVMMPMHMPMGTQGNMPGMMPGMMMPRDTTVRAATATDSTVRALQLRIEMLEARLRDAEARRVTPPSATPPAATTPMVEPMVERQMIVQIDTVIRGGRGTSPTERGTSSTQIVRVSPYVGGFDQMVLGVQLDAGPILGMQSLRFVPDFAIGLGSDPSVSLAAGAQYDFSVLRIDDKSAVRPHVRVGLGFLAASGDRDSQFGVNVAYGLTYVGSANARDPKRPALFIEHQGIDFFSTNRFLLGMRWQVR